jgi:glucokinase
VPGPVVDGRVTTTNLPWHVDERRLATALGMPPVKLINDLEAAGHGVLGLPADELAPLQRGTARDGARALIAAGTGLGEALLVRDAGAGERWTVIPSEGGHTDFGPRTDLEIDLLRFLGREFGHVSYERVLSGPGLFNVYRFLRASGFAPESPAVRAELETGDASAVVSERGLAGDDPLCAKALDVFVAVYGAEAANLALKALAVGGVIVAGGIAPKIFPCLAAGGFVAAFRDKGRLGSLLEGIPVHVAMNPRAPLLGAARVAAGLLRA